MLTVSSPAARITEQWDKTEAFLEAEHSDDRKLNTKMSNLPDYCHEAEVSINSDF